MAIDETTGAFDWAPASGRLKPSWPAKSGGRTCVQYPDDSGLIESCCLPIGIQAPSDRFLVFGQKLKRACDVAAQAIEKGEVVGR